MFSNQSVTKDMVNVFFRELRKKGYIAKHSYGATMNGGWYKMQQEYGEVKKAVFYTVQEEDVFVKRHFSNARYLDEPLYLIWSGDGLEIVETAKQCGLEAQWNGKEEQRIIILPQKIA